MGDCQNAGGSTRPSHDDNDAGERAPMMIMPPPSAPPLIMTSSRSSDGPIVIDGIENPSKVRNLKDILNYTTQMTNVNEQTALNNVLPQEKKEFLTSVLSSMTVNVQEEMNNSINVLLDPNKQVEEYETAFDVLGEYIDNIDYANDFQKLGGFQVIIPGLKSQYGIVRSKTSDMIATLVQNNPYSQEKFIENPAFISLLMNLVEHDFEETVRIKALHAISGLVRDNVTAFWKFIDLGGNDLIVSALKSLSDKLKIKAVFLVYSTCHMGNDVADMYVDNGVVQIICSSIMIMENTLEKYDHELFLSSLNQLLRMSPGRVKEICFSTKDDLKEALLSLQDSYPRDEYQDEKDQILWLMETLTL